MSDELVPKFEVERARNLLAELEQQATSARQAWRVHSANLTRVLRLNPLAVVVPLEHDHLQLTLIDPAQPLAELQKIALTNRPELASLAGAGPGGGGANPPGEAPPASTDRHNQWLPERRRHDDASRDLRPRPQQQPQSVDRP